VVTQDAFKFKVSLLCNFPFTDHINFYISSRRMCCARSRSPPVTDSTVQGLFSEVLAAPNGAPLTVYGTDLSGPLVVGGITMANCPSVDETVFEESLASIRLAKTTCWLENVPLGATSVDAGSSEQLPFQIINGTVQTVSSYGEFKDAMQDPAPGDFFLLKGFTVDLSSDDQANGGQHVLWMRNGEHNATPLNPIALIGYPGDPAKFVVDGVDNGNRAIGLQNTGWTIANLDFDTYWTTLEADGEARIIGNRIRGMTGPRDYSGSGTINAGGESKGGFIAGNVIFGGGTESRFDHAIYIQDCPSDKGWTVEWNHVVDNNFARGPQIVVNHQTPRCGTEGQNKSVASHTISNNVVDTSLYPGRCIGVAHYGWQPEYNSKPPGTVYVENNFLINCGFAEFGPVDSRGDSRAGAAIHVARGGMVIRGNTFYKADAGIALGTPTTQNHPDVGWLHTYVTDNTFIDSNESAIIEISLHPDIKDDITVENNVIR